MLKSAVAVPAGSKAAPTPIDREKTCPFLLRVFQKNGGHHTLQDFAVRGKEPVDDEVQIYTWPDATLREITDLIQAVNPDAKRRDRELSFAFVYPDRRGRNVLRPVGKIHSVRRGYDDVKTLASLNFVTGDFLDVSIEPSR
eukprot:GILJ01003396.1.p1 GENE.GILJ01003396.1~~GILJ01003396.1.p1  ORF type:complete len:141 (+),score=11.33 GILJ01003396.1:53-475(+)